jgi:hypothetical protein
VPLTPAQRHESKVNQTLHEWANKPTADPHAEVIARDAWARKVELHNAGWEITCDPPLKRAFHPGQYLTIVNNLAASTLTQGTVYGGDPTYIQVYNTPENIAKYVDYINENGVMVPGNSKPVVQGMTIRVRVVVRDNAQTVTVGKLVKYEVEVVEPHYLEGLRLLLQPEQLADDEGRDGYGNPVLSVK